MRNIFKIHTPVKIPVQLTRFPEISICKPLRPYIIHCTFFHFPNLTDIQCSHKIFLQYQICFSQGFSLIRNWLKCKGWIHCFIMIQTIADIRHTLFDHSVDPVHHVQNNEIFRIIRKMYYDLMLSHSYWLKCKTVLIAAVFFMEKEFKFVYLSALFIYCFCENCLLSLRNSHSYTYCFSHNIQWCIFNFGMLPFQTFFVKIILSSICRNYIFPFFCFTGI